MSQTDLNMTLTGAETAVIGMAGRFPGAADIHEFWDNLIEGKESVSFFNDEEIEQMRRDDEPVNHANFVKAKGGLLENIEYFDALFFGYSPREAELMDPQVRIFHECAWEALEDAGYNPDTYNGLIGLYAGASSNVFWRVKTTLLRKDKSPGDFEASLLMNRDFFCTRISYNLNLRGPSFTVQSACSTSLVAVHLACQAILNGECHMALAGGVSIASGGNKGYVYQEGMIFSPDGRCRAFDAKARGTIYGEGIGIVVLKSLEDALDDKDHIYAVIKGTAINNDGKRKVGYTAPGIGGQAEVIRVAHQVAEVEPGSITYIEAHGTGTELGDPVEIEALKLAFNTERKQFCGIGSVKTNIGHLDAAAGAAGLIKTVLALKYRRIPPSLHFETPNPKIDFENSPFYVVDKPKKWERNEYPLRAGVSSFGMGGTNAHVVLEEWPEDRRADGQKKPRLLLLSAGTETALERMTQNLADYLKKNPRADIADVAYTLQTGRKTFPFRRMLVCRNIDEASDMLSSGDGDGRKIGTHFCGEEKRNVVFMFSGLGEQYVSMGLELYREEQVFREEMDRCFEVLRGVLGYDIKEILYPSPSINASSDSIQNEDADNRINRFEISQLVIFVLEYASAKLLMEWGIRPQAIIGYSFGEYTAACLAGVFSLEDALGLIVDRGKLVNETGSGTMLSVPLSRDELMPLLDERLSIAIDNGPSCIVSGTREAVETFAEKMKAKRYICVSLKGTHAIHSSRMESILEAFKKRVGEIPLNEPQIPYISNVTGDWITVEDAVDPGYWARHLRQTVQFGKGINELIQQGKGNRIFVEIGPGHDLTVLLKHYIKKDSPQSVLNTVRYRKEKASDYLYLLNRVGRLWLMGVGIDWINFYAREERYKVSLPTYPFERQKYWIDGDPFRLMKEGALSGTRLEKGRDLSKWFYIPSWKQANLVDVDVSGSIRQWKWLVFVDENERSAAVVGALTQYTPDVITVRMGREFKELDSRTFIIDPRQPGDYDKVMGELLRRKQIPGKILHFWGLTGEAGGETLEEFQDRGLFSLLYIAQALGKLAVSDKIQINVVTDNTQEVIGGELLYPEKATIYGAVKIIPLEYFNIKCRAVDILVRDLETPANKDFIDRLILEFTSGADDPVDPVVVFRGNYRWVRDFRPVHLDKDSKGTRRLKEKGVYLITGGFGGMGLGIAGFLARQYKARLILVSRSGFLPVEEWDEWLASHGDDGENETYIKIGKLKEMQRNGGEVLILKADAADYESMKQAVARGEEAFGTINGVVHTAGIIDFNGVIQRRTREMTEENMAAKVNGTLVLDALFKDKPLDFMMFFSSIGDVLYGGKFGQVGYNSANEFLDAYAFYKPRDPGRNWYKITVNWSDWAEVGMAIKATHAFYKGDQNRINAELESLKDRALTPGEGVEVFSILLRYSLPRLVISPRNLQEELEKMYRQLKDVETNILEKIRGDDPGKPGSYYEKPELNAEYIAPGSDLEERVVRIWQDFFGYEGIGTADDFFRLGGNSLSAISVIAKINEQLHIDIPLAEFFNCPTVAGISEYIGKSETKVYRFIPKSEEKEYYPLFSGQLRLFILQQIETRSLRYHDTRLLELTGPLDMNKLEKAVIKLIERHEILRTSIEIVDEDPVQVVHPQVPFEIGYHETDETNTDDVIAGFVKPFALDRAPLFRVGVIKVKEQKHILIIDIHHIITDGISNVLFIGELMTLYRGRDLPLLSIQYRDFAGWKESKEQQEVIDRQEGYWLEQFAGDIPLLNLPTDFSRPAVQAVEGHAIAFVLESGNTKTLKKIAVEEGVTLFMVLLGIYNILLAKLSNQEDIVIGVPVAGRNHMDLENVIGMFVNTLPLRNFPSGQKTFQSFLVEVKNRSLQAFQNQDYPFDRLVGRAAVNRDMRRNPLFDAMFVLEHMDMSQIEMPGLKIDPYENERTTAKFDLTLTAAESRDKLNFNFEYCTRLFKKETIERFIGYFMRAVNAVIESPDMKLSDIDILDDEEKRFLLYDFNDTGADYPLDKTLHELFEEQAARTPARTAVIGRGRRAESAEQLHITYRLLNEKSDQLAYLLRQRGVQPDTIVGIMMERSLEMIIGIMGILKAGGAYLPIDPDYPRDRIDYMLKDSNARVLVSELSEVSGGIEVIKPGELSEKLPTHLTHLTHLAHPTQLCYIIYTSGSTGRPKGVMIEHTSVVNRLKWMQKRYPLQESDTILQKTPFTFDVSVWELFWWALEGASLCLLQPGREKEPEVIVDAVEKNHVTVMHFVPSMLNAFLEYVAVSGCIEKLPGLRQVFSSGEALTLMHVEAFSELLYNWHNTKLTNLYGPTEATVDVSYFDCTEGKALERVPIGKPIDNIQLFILSKEKHLQPLGIPGELFIAGIGLARGYLNRPELTAEKFGQDLLDYQDYHDEKKKENYQKFFRGSRGAILQNPPPCLFYKTGDLARFLSDGNIEFLGRIDHQVKIRGFRIELEEIQCRLLEHPEIKDAAVIAKQNPDREHYLCAYIVSGHKFPLNELKEYLLNYLPGYMVPSYFFQLDKIPLTPNGKIDKRTLESEGSKISTEVEYVPPGTGMEEMIVNVWKEVLHMEKIGINDNFFDSGGNSLSIIKINTKINERLKRNIPVVEMFSHPTVHSLVRYLSKGEDYPFISSEEVIAEDINLFEETSRMLMENE